jgi:hypothetical protein
MQIVGLYAMASVLAQGGCGAGGGPAEDGFPDVRSAQDADVDEGDVQSPDSRDVGGIDEAGEAGDGSAYDVTGTQETVDAPVPDVTGTQEVADVPTADAVGTPIELQVTGTVFAGTSAGGGWKLRPVAYCASAGGLSSGGKWQLLGAGVGGGNP